MTLFLITDQEFDTSNPIWPLNDPFFSSLQTKDLSFDYLTPKWPLFFRFNPIWPLNYPFFLPTDQRFNSSDTIWPLTDPFFSSLQTEEAAGPKWTEVWEGRLETYTPIFLPIVFLVFNIAYWPYFLSKRTYQATWGCCLVLWGWWLIPMMFVWI